VGLVDGADDEAAGIPRDRAADGFGTAAVLVDVDVDCSDDEDPLFRVVLVGLLCARLAGAAEGSVAGVSIEGGPVADASS
jgi:hypothetical protein